MKREKPVWDKPRPSRLEDSKPLTSKQKTSAKQRAKASGRPYPNLIDNMAASKKRQGGW